MKKYFLVLMLCVGSTAQATDCCDPWSFYVKGGVGDHFGSNTSEMLGLGTRYHLFEDWKIDVSASAETAQSSRLYTGKALVLWYADQNPYNALYFGAGLGYGHLRASTPVVVVVVDRWDESKRIVKWAKARGSTNYMSLDLVTGFEFWRSCALRPFLQAEASTALITSNKWKGQKDTYTLTLGVLF